MHYYYGGGGGGGGGGGATIWLAWTYKLLRNPKAKIVVTCHGSDIYLYKPESKLYKFAASAVDFFVFTSESLREKFFRSKCAKYGATRRDPSNLFATSQQLSLPEKAVDVLFCWNSRSRQRRR
ncbi:MAG: hypothetical protein U5L01_03270 [Rheinheimera sp.]|nr:hypothetical protein [Rheinheimera sp.]